jgi:hypothetical protein
VGNSILLIVLGWAIPGGLAGLWAKLSSPEFNAKYPLATTLVLSSLFAVAISITTLTVYDRFWVPENVVVFVPEGDTCPSGYFNDSVVLMPHNIIAEKRFQVSKDFDPKEGPITDGKWPWDHMRLCLKK